MRTSISVDESTRDRVNRLAEQRKATVEDTINYLLDELWRSRCIDQADRLRETDPEAWSREMAAARYLDYRLSPGRAA